MVCSQVLRQQLAMRVNRGETRYSNWQVRHVLKVGTIDHKKFPQCLNAFF
jgi:hypothetical protein